MLVVGTGCLHAVGPRPPVLPSATGGGTVGFAAGMLPHEDFNEPVFAIQYHRPVNGPRLQVGLILANGWQPFAIDDDPPRFPSIDLAGFVTYTAIEGDSLTLMIEGGGAPYVAAPHPVGVGLSAWSGLRVATRDDFGSLYARVEAGGGGSAFAQATGSITALGMHALGGIGTEIGRGRLRANLEVLGVFRAAKYGTTGRDGLPVNRSGTDACLMGSLGIAFDIGR